MCFFGTAQTVATWNRQKKILLVQFCCSAPSSVSATGPWHVPLSLSARPLSTLSYTECNGEKPGCFIFRCHHLQCGDVKTSGECGKCLLAGQQASRSSRLSEVPCLHRFSSSFFCLNIGAGLSGVLPQMACIKSISTPKLVGLAYWTTTTTFPQIFSHFEI